MVTISFVVAGLLFRCIGTDFKVALFVGLLGTALGVSQVLQAARRGLNDFFLGQVPFEVIRPLLSLGLMGIAVWAVGASAPAATMAIFIATLITLLPLAVPLLFRRGDVGAKQLQIPYQTLGWFLVVTIGTSLIGRVEVLIVGITQDSGGVGDLVLAIRVAQLGTFGLSLAGFRYAGEVASAFSAGNIHIVQERIRRSTAVGGCRVRHSGCRSYVSRSGSGLESLRRRYRGSRSQLFPGRTCAASERFHGSYDDDDVHGGA